MDSLPEMVVLRTPRLAILVAIQVDYIRLPKQARELQKLIERARALDRSTEPIRGGESNSKIDVRQTLYCRIVRLEEFKPIGQVSSIWVPDPGFCYVGYSVDSDFSGNGYASEAVKEVIQWILSWSEVKAVVSETFPEAIASIRVMEKCGMVEVDANVRPSMVRRAIVKPGADVDLVEHQIVRLIPFTYSKTFLGRRYLIWQLERYGELVWLIVLVAMSFFCAEWAPIWVLATLGYGGLLFWRFAKWVRSPIYENIVQFRDSALFHADRSGRGGVTPWSTFSIYRLPKQGGIELWNGTNWYPIPAAAFNETLLKEAKAFVVAKGIVEAPN